MHHIFYRSDFTTDSAGDSYFNYLLGSVGIDSNEWENYQSVQLDITVITKIEPKHKHITLQS